MRRRIVGAVAILVVAAGTLTACRSNVGLAAEIQGHRYSESDISDYVTPAAQPIKEYVDANSMTTVSVPPKVVVLQILVESKLAELAIAKLQISTPTAGQLATIEKGLYRGKSLAAFAEGDGVKGYSTSFQKVYLRDQAYVKIIKDFAARVKQEAGVDLDLNKVIGAVQIDVRVNPRYGTWDAKNKALAVGPTSALPDFLKLTSDLAAGSATTPR